uniref:Uncharacterized protein n=2 Tax=viral metagenome TaxID=1070528 RepID=A0A6H1ZUV2_9ZZZZ
MGKKKINKEKIKLKLRPEDIVKYCHKNDSLPDDFNPYGNYTPDKLRFLGDVVPPNTDYCFLINDLDLDRKQIVISLPEPPTDLTRIDGYNLNHDCQVFRRLAIPDELAEIETEALGELLDIQKGNRQEAITGYKLLNGFWDKFNEKYDELNDAIEFIKRVWWYRLNGYWFYNDGKPTYITGRHFMWLNFFWMPDVRGNGGYPEFRDRHRREYLFRDYLRGATETFVNRDDRGWAVPKEDGRYEMRDMGMRLFYGDIHPKSRRNGSTIMSLSDMIEESERDFGIYSTIISKDGEATEEHYNTHLLPAWAARPLFLKPIWYGGNSPKQIKYFPPRNAFMIEALKSVIDYTVSGGELKKVGSKFNGFISFDEEGDSAANIDVLARWDANKNAMALGDGSIILGYCSHISTVEEINSSGKAYLDMLGLSDFYQRGDNGQTTSGLGAMMFPAYDGQEGFIGPFGESVMDAPTERQMKLRPKAQFTILGQGARQYQQEKRDDFIKKGTPAAMQSYRAYIKKYPWRSNELSIGTSGDLGFDYELLDRRLTELRKMKSFDRLPIKIGNFYRVNNQPEGEVYFKEEEEGKFELSMDIPKGQTNLKRVNDGWDVSKGMFVPMYEPVYKTRFTVGADPFDYSNQRGNVSMGYQSDGGIAVLWEYDPTIDGGRDDPSAWESRRFVCSYRYRTASLDEYNEDVLMCCEYFGGMLYLERNKTRTWEHFIARSRGGYLKFDQNLMTGQIADKPGFYSLTANKDELFSEIKDYINFRGHKEVHVSFLEECRNIRSKDEMTRYDRLTAHGAALLGSRSVYGRAEELMGSQTVDFSGYNLFRKHKY